MSRENLLPLSVPCFWPCKGSGDRHEGPGSSATPSESANACTPDSGLAVPSPAAEPSTVSHEAEEPRALLPVLEAPLCDAVITERKEKPGEIVAAIVLPRVSLLLRLARVKCSAAARHSRLAKADGGVLQSALNLMIQRRLEETNINETPKAKNAGKYGYYW